MDGGKGRRAVFAHKSDVCTQEASGRRAVFAYKRRVIDERCLHTRSEW